jgi:hypothetical protein
METVYVRYRMDGENSAAARAWTALQDRKNNLIDGPIVTAGGLEGQIPSLLKNVETFVEDKDALITKASTSISPLEDKREAASRGVAVLKDSDGTARQQVLDYSNIYGVTIAKTVIQVLFLLVLGYLFFNRGSGGQKNIAIFLSAWAAILIGWLLLKLVFGGMYRAVGPRTNLGV